jgi:carbonic anhydrase
MSGMMVASPSGKVLNKMKRFNRVILFAAIVVASIALNSCMSETTTPAGIDTVPISSPAFDSADLHSPQQIVTSANTALNLLKVGNKRYVDNTLAPKTNEQDRTEFKDGQNPFAVVIACADSRVAPEIFFDQDLGDIFVIRNAGNVAEETVLGSIEYAVEHLGVPLVVVVGHSKCGAVTAATSGGSKLPQKLMKLINIVKSNIESFDIDTAVHENAASVAAKVLEDEVVEELGITVVSAYYNIETGVVDWDAT